MPSITLVVPVLNEEDTIPELLRRFRTALDDRKDFVLDEMLFVDDGSHDRTFELLETAAQKDHRIKIISFSRNFGHQIAVSAAFDHAEGDAVVVIDGDLQDPPEFIPTMVAKWKEGNAIVYAVRKKRKEGILKRATAAMFYRLLRIISEVDIPLDAGDFALLDKKVVDVMKRMPERSRYIRGLRAWSGFKSIGVEYDRASREAGESKYTLKKMIDLAATGIIGFSTVPLRIATYIGMFMALASIVGGVFVFVQWLVGWPGLVRGWASLMIGFFFVSGIQLFLLGVIGEYIGRIYREVQARPLYIVHKKVGFSAEQRVAPKTK